MNKKCILSAALLFSGIGSAEAATIYTGSLQTSDGSLIAQDLWTDAVFSWEVSDFVNADGVIQWAYHYTWTGTVKDLSHIDIETDAGFTAADIVSAITSPDSVMEGPALFTESAGDIYGLKWNLSEDSLGFEATLITSYAPIWGDMFAKDGRDPATTELVFAHNSMFGTDTLLAAADGNNGGWTLIPGSETSLPPTSTVPVPAAAWLFGSGLLGMVGVARRGNKAAM